MCPQHLCILHCLIIGRSKFMWVLGEYLNNFRPLPISLALELTPLFFANFPSIIYPQKSWYGENVVMEIKRIIADAKTGETLTTFPAKKAPREFLVWDLRGEDIARSRWRAKHSGSQSFLIKVRRHIYVPSVFGNFLTPWVPNMTKSECSCPSWHCPWQGDDLIELTFRRWQWKLEGR